jgi:hypothetical protein
MFYKGLVKAIGEKGVVEVLIPELMMISDTEPSSYLRCFPVINYNFFPVKVDDNVMVFFIGNMQTGFWFSRWSMSSFVEDVTVDGIFTIFKEGDFEIKVDTNNSENKLSLIVGSAVIDMKTNGSINVNSGGANVVVDSGGGNVEINGNTKKFVTHTELDIALQLFATSLNLHVHNLITPSPGSPTGPPIPTMSLDISSSATTTVKTGG